MRHYLKYAYIPVVFVNLTLAAMLWAPQWVLCVSTLFFIHQVGRDVGTPRELSLPNYRFPWILDALLYLWAVESMRSLAVLLWLAAPGDLGGLGGWMESHIAPGVLQAKAEVGWLAVLSAAAALGVFLSGNMTAGHELIHRTHHRPSMFVGRWLLAMVGQAHFSIFHIYGHHLHVGTPQDCATARRGENLYGFAVRATIGEFRCAWQLERQRLAGQPFWLFLLTNRVSTGLVPTAALFALFWAFGGARGVAAYITMLVVSTFAYQAVQYIEHYGLVRVAGTPVAPRHSWGCSTSASSHALINLTRHSHHHADARVKYWELVPMDGTLDLPYGYAGHSALAMIPPLWYRFAHPRLAQWDADLATPAEREIVQRQAWVPQAGHAA